VITVLAATAGIVGMTVWMRADAADTFPTPLPNDSELKVNTLPAQYPKGWAFLAYANDKFEIRDVGSDARTVEGQLPGFESATLLVGTRRPELYVADTVWARGNHGTRTDFITIYDKRTLTVSGEVVLPGAKRGLIVPMQGMFAFADEERLALVFNFTPAMSVTVVDLEKRKVLSEVETPGCSLVYPTGRRGFSSLCASGTLLSVQLDAQGHVASRRESSPFNKLDTDPLLTSAAQVDGVSYFPSLLGRIQPLDLRDEEAKILPDWPLVPASEAAESWRPSGLQLIAASDDGHLYVLMQRDAHEGTHKDPGTEVWVYDPQTRARVQRLRLVRPGTSIAVTHEEEPKLLVAASDQLDVYSLPQGALVRSLDAAARRGGMLIEAVK
jgi:methylamine dehydrogenase heavy chain